MRTTEKEQWLLRPRELWNNWSIQFLVLFSLKIQMVLFLFAGIRRRRAHGLSRSLLWLAYQLADYTPTYALGHLSLSGAHPMVALWAPFFLLHLGGPDNITAYSLEDNKLWKRHLLNAMLQVLGALYVLYEHVASKENSLWLAYILMLLVGAVKYGEKTRALMCSNLDTIRHSVRKQPPAMHGHFHPQDFQVFKGGRELDEESLVRRAHSLFHICKHAIVHDEMVEEDDDSRGGDTTTRMLVGVGLWNLTETELSLMYDVLYTKAAVIHTLFGYLVRLVSPLAVLASLLLFRLTSNKDIHSEADVVITYVLYAGALFMETTSLLNALGSSWTFAFLSTTRWSWLRFAALCSGRWDRLRGFVVYLHNLVRVDRVYTEWYGAIDSPGIGSRSKWVEEPLVRNGLFQGILKDSLGAEFQECIIIWHIGTDIFLAKRERNEETSLDVEAIKMISNYMMFLLVEQPDMLPGFSRDLLYQRTCEKLIKTRRLTYPRYETLCAELKNLFRLYDDPGSKSRVTDRVELAETIYNEYESKAFSYDAPRLPHAVKLAKELLRMEKNCGAAHAVKLVLDEWTYILVYAGNKCSRKAHAEKLNSGGELITILWLMAENLYQIYLERRRREQ
uniref:Uncharacterized protein n=1 Tax=Avena sativa TaxID=4498 RepID=A0ACD5WL04_AVESA